MVQVQVTRGDSSSLRVGDSDVRIWVTDNTRSWAIELFETNQAIYASESDPAPGWGIQEFEPLNAAWNPGRGAKRGSLEVIGWRPVAKRSWGVPISAGLDVLHDVLSHVMGRRRAGKVMDAIIGLEVPSGTTS